MTPGAPSIEAESRCPLCAGAARPFMEVKQCRYWRCRVCAATFLAAPQRPGLQAERDHYLRHENDPADARYRRFLNRLAAPLLARLPPRQDGLDYGCGPGPALAQMLGEAGHRMALYDPFFFADPEVLGRTYDFITCTETAEHFHQPAAEFARLTGMIRPGGWLAIMTCFQTEDARFAAWHYRRDPTHVMFYREETFRFLARQYGWHCEVPQKDVVLMRRPFGRSTRGARRRDVACEDMNCGGVERVKGIEPSS